MLEANDMLVDDAPPDDGPLAPRQSYNFAPTYHGVVLRAADAPPPPQDNNASPPTDPSSATSSTPTPNGQKQQRYILQTMKWGLIPSWTAKTTPQKQQASTTATALKTINCRAESLASSSGFWSRLRDKRRCVVLADGFYEWLKTGPGGKQRVPYYVKRRDGRVMCFAGLWDYVPPSKSREGEVVGSGSGEGVYSYTIITTTSCKALNFLHDRMPVLMEAGGEEMRRWLGVGAGTFGGVAGLLKPWGVEGGLEVYRVSADVGRVGRDEKRFVERVEGGRGDIAGWFRGAGGKGKDGGKDGDGDGDGEKGKDKGKDVEIEVKDEEGEVKREMKSVEEVEEDAGVPEKGVKREAEDETKDEPPPKKKMMGLASPSPVKSRPKISATRNVHKSPKKGVKGKADGSQKITKFFGNSA